MENKEDAKILRFVCLKCRHKFTQPCAQYAISQSLEKIVISICPACSSGNIIFNASENAHENQERIN
jgi:hypothetical protein